MNEIHETIQYFYFEFCDHKETTVALRNNNSTLFTQVLVPFLPMAVTLRDFFLVASIW